MWEGATNQVAVTSQVAIEMMGKEMVDVDDSALQNLSILLSLLCLSGRLERTQRCTTVRVQRLGRGRWAACNPFYRRA